MGIRQEQEQDSKYGQDGGLQGSGPSGSGSAGFGASGPPGSRAEHGGEGALEAGGGVLEWGHAGWLPGNPLGVPTEREVYVQQSTGCSSIGVFRCLLVRRAEGQ